MLAATLFQLHPMIPKKGVDLIEIRVDQCNESLETIFKYMNQQTLPILLTYRKDNLDEKEYAKILYELARLQPSYLDVEWGVSSSLVDTLRLIAPKTKFILSYHSQEATSSLDEIYEEMKKNRADYYKIVTMAFKGIDGLRLLDFLQRNQDGKLTAFCMGEKGQFTRILSKVLGGSFHFCSLETSPPYGQFSLDHLSKVYRFQGLSSSTKIYGLIGSPIDKSPSDITHNEVFHLMNNNACYVKVDLVEEDVEEGFALLKKLHFQGLSVTMPLKKALSESVLLEDPISQDFNILNTLVFSSEIKGYNTDALALRRIFEKYQMQGKRVFVVGAGAVAQIVCYLLHQLGCQLLHWNRTLEKLTPFLPRYGGALYTEGDSYDILINTTSQGMDGLSIPVKPEWIQPTSLVFDVITSPAWTPLLKAAKEKGCALIFGSEMFALQAAFQFCLWS